MAPMASLVFTALVSAQVVCGDWPTIFTKNMKAPLIEPINEPLNNASPYEQVHYSVANLSNDFKSSTKFQPRGMAHLYELTEKFINFISDGEAFPEGFLEVTEDHSLRMDDIGTKWPVLLRHYGKILAVILCTVLFATVMPIIGLTFCCCRCVGRCGARSQPFDKRYDPCRRHFYGAILVSITVLISFGVICAFTTNEVLEEGVKDLPKHVRVSMTDTELYINNTKKEVNTLLLVNFKELETFLYNILNASGKIVLDKLAQATNATVLYNLTNVVDGLALIKNDLKKINIYTETLRERSSMLEHGLKEIGEHIEISINACKGEPACDRFRSRYPRVGQLSLEANFSQLPNVTASLKNLSDLSDAGIEDEVLKGRKQFEKIRQGVEDSVGRHIPEIMDKISEAGESIEKGAHRIIRILDNMRNVLSDHVDQPIDNGQKMISDFSPYRYYVCFGVSCALLAILISLTFGLLCGCCGSRPNSGYQEDCCNKGAGSRYLMLAVWLMFLSSGVLMAVALVYFAAGVTTEKVICQSLNNTHNSRTFSLLDQLVNVSRFYTSEKQGDIYDPVNLKTIIRSCHKNLSLYQVLQLAKEIDVSEFASYSKHFGIEERTKELVRNIKLNQNITIITPEARNLLLQLADSKLNNINFPAYMNLISEKMTSIDLLQLASALNETAGSITTKFSQIAYDLHNRALYLHTHQETHVNEMIRITKQLESTAAQLEEHLKFNHTTLKAAVVHLLREVESAQNELQRRGHAVVIKLAQDFGHEFISHIDEYLGKVVRRMQGDIGRCWPVSQAYNATVMAGCKRILSPFNGFWFSVGAVVLLFIPTIVICVMLASLYQKCDPYPGPLVEAEYLYDICGGGDRDNIPLASVHDKKKRKSNRRAVEESCSNGHASGHGAGHANSSQGANNVDRARSRSHATSAVSHPGSPPLVSTSVPLNSAAAAAGGDESKQRWDFPASNLNGANFPNNVAQLNEYERPPPYYYPGPTPQGLSDCSQNFERQRWRHLMDEWSQYVSECSGDVTAY